MGEETNKTDLTYPPATVQAILDNLFSEAGSLDFAEARADVVGGLNKLPNRERAVLAYRAMGFSQAWVAQQMGVSKWKVQQIEKQAFVLLVLILNPELWLVA